jgi:hypothetical protein
MFYKYKNEKKHIEYKSIIQSDYHYNDAFFTIKYKINKPTFEEIENAYKKDSLSHLVNAVEMKHELDKVLKNYLDNNELTQKHLIIYFGVHIFDIEILDNVGNDSVVIKLKMYDGDYPF